MLLVCAARSSSPSASAASDAQTSRPDGGSFCFPDTPSTRPARSTRTAPMDTQIDPQGEFHVYDTTLRDGAQQEGLNLSVADKLTIARQLDELGVGFIEGGWQGARPKDKDLFVRGRGQPVLRPSRLTSCGAIRPPRLRA